MTDIPGAMNTNVIGGPVDPNPARLTYGLLPGVITFPDADKPEAVIALDDGTTHTIEWTGSVLPISDGDRIEFRMVAEDGWIISYDVYPEGWT